MKFFCFDGVKKFLKISGPIVDEEEIDAIIDHLLATFLAFCDSDAKQMNWTGAKQRDYIVKVSKSKFEKNLKKKQGD